MDTPLASHDLFFCFVLVFFGRGAFLVSFLCLIFSFGCRRGQVHACVPCGGLLAHERWSASRRTRGAATGDPFLEGAQFVSYYPIRKCPFSALNSFIGLNFNNALRRKGEIKKNAAGGSAHYPPSPARWIAWRPLFICLISVNLTNFGRNYTAIVARGEAF